MATATATRTVKGFKVVCPFCGDSEATVKLDLNALQTLTCTACDEEFSAADAVARVRDQLKRWEAIARWVEMAGSAIDGEEA
jgi:transposase-like protein